MNAEHEMLVDTLKGHSYKMSPWQYYEVRHHMDAELMYAVTTEVALFIDALQAKGNGTYRVMDLLQLVAESVAKVLCERENAIFGAIRINKTVNKMYAAYSAMPEKEQGCMKVANTFLIYAVNDILIQIKYIQ